MRLGLMLGYSGAEVKLDVGLAQEAEGFSHVHFHVIPRMADQPEELRGPRIFGMLGLPPDACVSDVEMDRIGSELRERLTRGAR